MNISSGISHIKYETSLGKTQDTYVWPAYNAGKVNKVFPVKQGLSENGSYVQPQEPVKTNLQYTHNGKAICAPENYYPGKFINFTI